MLSKLCKLILWLLPPLMVYGHLRAIGVTWNYAERTTFSPITNCVSDYAYRSPAWWAIVACIYGFAFVLGFISWHAANRQRTFVSWVVAAAAAIAMFKMTEVALYPVKSPEVTITRIQEELSKGPLEKSRDEIWRAYLKVTGKPVPTSTTVGEFLKTHQSDRLHLGGIKPAWLMMIVTMIGAFFIWRKSASSANRWRGIHAIAFGLILIGILGSQWKPEWIGLFQRVSFAGTYVWMWLIVLAIEREKQGLIKRAISA